MTRKQQPPPGAPAPGPAPGPLPEWAEVERATVGAASSWAPGQGETVTSRVLAALRPLWQRQQASLAEARAGQAAAEARQLDREIVFRQALKRARPLIEENVDPDDEGGEMQSSESYERALAVIDAALLPAPAPPPGGLLEIVADAEGSPGDATWSCWYVSGRLRECIGLPPRGDHP